ncbi:Rnf-Nqr domain containing protein [Shigella flexneri]
MMIITFGRGRCKMLINAYAFRLSGSLGIFIPLIVTNCIVVGRAAPPKKVRRFRHWTAFQIGMGATCAVFI